MKKYLLILLITVVGKAYRAAMGGASEHYVLILEENNQFRTIVVDQRIYKATKLGTQIIEI